MVPNRSYVIFGLCVIENIFWKNSVLYNPSWNNLSIYLLWLQSSRTNVNVLRIMFVPVQLQFCIGNSPTIASWNKPSFQLKTHIEDPGPETGRAICWTQIMCVNTADVEMRPQPDPHYKQEKIAGVGDSLWPDCAKRSRGHLVIFRPLTSVKCVCVYLSIFIYINFYINFI